MLNNLWKLEQQGTSYDDVVVLDADNIVSPNLLNEFNGRLLQGSEVMQAYLDSKNPTDTWITKAMHWRIG